MSFRFYHEFPLSVEAKSDDMMSVTVRSEDDTYKLARMRFHWGQNDSVGSEHTINGKSYPMEIQFLLYDSYHPDKSYEASMVDGFGFFTDIVNALNSIQEVGQTTTIPKLNSSFEQLLPAKRNSFYDYYGSVTTPPCGESQWVIYEELQTISSDQLEEFRQMNAKYGGKLVNNYRPLQPLDDRDIYYHT